MIPTGVQTYYVYNCGKCGRELHTVFKDSVGQCHKCGIAANGSVPHKKVTRSLVGTGSVPRDQTSTGVTPRLV